MESFVTDVSVTPEHTFVMESEAGKSTGWLLKRWSSTVSSFIYKISRCPDRSETIVRENTNST